MTAPSSAFLNNVMDLMLDTICVVDAEGCFMFVSASCERLFGYSPAEMVGRPMIGFVHPDDRERTLQAATEIMAGEPKFHFENRYVRKDGRVVHVMWSARWSETDQLRIAVARDITERKRTESVKAGLFALSEAAHGTADLPALFQRVHRILDGLLAARRCLVALYDADRNELAFPYCADATGEPCNAALTPGPLDDSTLSAAVIRGGQALLLTAADRAALGRGPWRDVDAGAQDWLGVPLAAQHGAIGALVVQSRAGDARYEERDSELLQFIAAQLAAAIERRWMETRLLHLARHDPLTDLPNRALVHDNLRAALARARRDSGRLALLYLDLDLFKPINDRLGHAVGDLLLQEVAHRLRGSVRESDTVGRIGGDEFLVLLDGVGVPEHATAVAEKIRAALGEPFEIAGHQLRVAPSIGVALYPEHGDEAQQLILRADAAMYDAKRAGGDRFCTALAGDPPAR